MCVKCVCVCKSKRERKRKKGECEKGKRTNKSSGWINDTKRVYVAESSRSSSNINNPFCPRECVYNCCWLMMAVWLLFSGSCCWRYLRTADDRLIGLVHLFVLSGGPSTRYLILFVFGIQYDGWMMMNMIIWENTSTLLLYNPLCTMSIYHTYGSSYITHSIKISLSFSTQLFLPPCAPCRVPLLC